MALFTDRFIKVPIDVYSKEDDIMGKQTLNEMKKLICILGIVLIFSSCQTAYIMSGGVPSVNDTITHHNQQYKVVSIKERTKGIKVKTVKIN